MQQHLKMNQQMCKNSQMKKKNMSSGHERGFVKEPNVKQQMQES